MSKPIVKRELLKQAYHSGDYSKALSIAAKFPGMGKESPEIVLAHECNWNPSFYQKLGYNPEESVKAGLETLRIKFNLF